MVIIIIVIAQMNWDRLRYSMEDKRMNEFNQTDIMSIIDNCNI